MKDYVIPAAILLVIVLVLRFVIFPPQQTVTTTTEYKVGETTSELIKGKPIVTTEWKAETVKPKKIIRNEKATTPIDTTLNFETDNLKLSVEVKEDSSGEITINPFWDLLSFMTERVDTIKESRVDTLNTTIEIINEPFYEAWWFKIIAVLTTVLFLLSLK